MDSFRTFLSHCELCDLGFKGLSFTWSKNRERVDKISMRDWIVMWQIRVGLILTMRRG